MLEKKQVSKILDTMKERFPKADTTLEKTDPFHFLLSIILSAQATDVSVNKATPALFKAYATPADLAQADPSEVEKYIKTIGLYHNKAKYLVGCAKDLVERFDGKVPKTREEFEGRALLYHILMDLEEFLVYKKRFVNGLDEKKLRIYWKQEMEQKDSANELQK